MKLLLAEYAAVCIVVSQIFDIASEEIGVIFANLFQYRMEKKQQQQQRMQTARNRF